MRVLLLIIALLVAIPAVQAQVTASGGASFSGGATVPEASAEWGECDGGTTFPCIKSFESEVNCAGDDGTVLSGSEPSETSCVDTTWPQVGSYNVMTFADTTTSEVRFDNAWDSGDYSTDLWMRCGFYVDAWGDSSSNVVIHMFVNTTEHNSGFRMNDSTWRVMSNGEHSSPTDDCSTNHDLDSDLEFKLHFSMSDANTTLWIDPDGLGFDFCKSNDAAGSLPAIDGFSLTTAGNDDSKVYFDMCCFNSEDTWAGCPSIW